MMKILQITRGLSDRGGGVENIVLNLASCLRRDRANHELIVATSMIDLAGYKKLDFKVIKLSQSKLPGIRLGRFCRDGLRKLQELNVDVIHAHSIPSPGLLGLLLKLKMKRQRKSSVPLIVTTHGTDVSLLSQRYIFRKLNHYILSRCDQITAVSAYLQCQIKTIFGLDAIHIPNGVDTKLFSPSSERTIEKNIDVLFVGMLRAEKNIYRLLDAVAQIPDINMTLIGNGTPRATALLKRKLVKLNLMRRVTFLGAIPNSQLPAYYNRAKLVVLPSITEGAGQVILEALGCEVPVVASNVGGIPELVRNGRTGLTFKPHNLQQLMDNIKLLLHDPKLRRKLGEAGRKLIVKNYDWHKIYKMYERLYTELIDRV
jgi:glycosyltransferase involved in cell wall biosynthesis